MIQFHCTSCSKTLSVDEKHAGKTAKCPKCQTQLRIPDRTSAEPAPTMATKRANDPFADLPLPPLTLPTSSAPAPSSYGPTAASSSPTAGPTSASYGQYAQSARPAATKTGSTTSVGRSIGGLAAASGIAFLGAIIWLIVALITQLELGILAWGIGGLIGLVAGKIARNPSVAYCSVVGGLAAMSIFGVKFIMAFAMVLMSIGTSFIEEMVAMGLADDKYSYALKDEMLDTGGFDANEQKLVKEQVQEFFLTTSSVGMDDEAFGEEEFDSDIETDWQEASKLYTSINKKVRDRLKTMTMEQKDQLVQRAAKKYPTWFEWEHEYQAIVHDLLNSGGLADPGVRAHAEHEMKEIDSGYDEAYYDAHAPREIENRGKNLQKLASERRAALDPKSMDDLVIAMTKAHANWSGHPDQSFAVMEKMYRENQFGNPLQKHVKSQIQITLNPSEDSDGFDSFDGTNWLELEKQTNAAVNERIVALSLEERTQLVKDLEASHPSWRNPFAEMDESFGEFKREVGENVTLFQAFKKLLTPIDALWLFLAVTTAFGTARRVGQTALE